MTEHIPALTIEALADGSLFVQQDDGRGNMGRVVLHPVHLRLIAERMHLTSTSDRQAHASIRTLERRLGLLRDRIGYLAYWLDKHADHRHANLDYECSLASAAADLADEFCADLMLKPERPGQPAPPSTASPAPRPQRQQDAKAKPQGADEPQLFALTDPEDDGASGTGQLA